MLLVYLFPESHKENWKVNLRPRQTRPWASWISQRELKESHSYRLMGRIGQNLTKRIESLFGPFTSLIFQITESHKENWKRQGVSAAQTRKGGNLTKRIESRAVCGWGLRAWRSRNLTKRIERKWLSSPSRVLKPPNLTKRIERFPLPSSSGAKASMNLTKRIER